MTVHSRTLALLGLLGACDEGLESAPPIAAAVAQAVAPVDPAPVVVAAPAPVAAPAVAPAVTPSAALEAWLRAAAVTDTTYARRTLYSWASPPAVARLRRDDELFDDAQLPEGPTAYVQWVEHLASRDDSTGAIAKILLGHPDLARRRYAWVRPWATRLGMVRAYGDQLIAVTLESDAIIGRLDASLDVPWEFRDLDDRVVPIGRVLADPSRVAAIYHVRRDAEPHFREYVLCNESVIASWSLATPEIADVIAEDAAFVRELAPIVAEVAAYADVRAFGVDHYAPTPAMLTAVADALEASAQVGRPHRVAPKHRFRRRAAPGLVRIREVPPRFVASV